MKRCSHGREAVGARESTGVAAFEALELIVTSVSAGPGGTSCGVGESVVKLFLLGAISLEVSKKVA